MVLNAIGTLIRYVRFYRKMKMKSVLKYSGYRGTAALRKLKNNSERPETNYAET